MKRERALQVVLVLVGLLYVAWAFPLFQSLWHSSWLQQREDAFPMFTSVNTLLGVFLLLAVKQPARHRSQSIQCIQGRSPWRRTSLLRA